MIWIDAGRRFAPPLVARTALVVAAMPVASWWLAPWKLFTKTTIDEMLPPGARRTQLGQFSSHIHRTSGAARLATLPDGSRILRLENLHATLSDARVANGRGRFEGSVSAIAPISVPCAPTGAAPTTPYPSFGAAELRFVPQSLDTPLRGLTVRPARALSPG